VRQGTSRCGAGARDSTPIESRLRRSPGTITVGVDADRLSRSRFAVSRLVELTNGLEVLAHPDRAPSARSWVARTRRTLDRGRAAVVLSLVGSATWYVPDFLVPIPATYEPQLDDELAAVAATPPAEVVEQLRLAFRIGPPPEAAVARTRAHPGDDPRAPLPPAVGDLLATAGPGALAARAAAELRYCWRAALAAWWPEVRRTLDEDVRHRATEASRAGFAHLVPGLHPGVGWTGQRVELDHPNDVALDGAGGLVMTPSIFLPRPAVWLGRAAEVMIGYPARGRAALWASPPTPNGEQLLLGRTRARLLADLTTPRSTTELAARHRVSPATVSYHLTRLHRAGLVQRRQAGHSVLYERTNRGDEVLEAFG
jgi:DNA-binding transcriptional ArsR family regulator